jgi:hypothetical protein
MAEGVSKKDEAIAQSVLTALSVAAGLEIRGRAQGKSVRPHQGDRSAA